MWAWAGQWTRGRVGVWYGHRHRLGWAQRPAMMNGFSVAGCRGAYAAGDAGDAVGGAGDSGVGDGAGNAGNAGNAVGGAGGCIGDPM